MALDEIQPIQHVVLLPGAEGDVFPAAFAAAPLIDCQQVAIVLVEPPGDSGKILQGVGSVSVGTKYNSFRILASEIAAEQRGVVHGGTNLQFVLFPVLQPLLILFRNPSVPIQRHGFGLSILLFLSAVAPQAFPRHRKIKKLIANGGISQCSPGSRCGTDYFCAILVLASHTPSPLVINAFMQDFRY